MKRMTSRDLVIAETVSRRRVALGLSPRSVKQLCGVEPRDLKRYEAGMVPLSPRRLQKICQALLLQPEDLVALISRD